MIYFVIIAIISPMLFYIGCSAFLCPCVSIERNDVWWLHRAARERWIRCSEVIGLDPFQKRRVPPRKSRANAAHRNEATNGWIYRDEAVKNWNLQVYSLCVGLFSVGTTVLTLGSLTPSIPDWLDFGVNLTSLTKFLENFVVFQLKKFCNFSSRSWFTFDW